MRLMRNLAFCGLFIAAALALGCQKSKNTLPTEDQIQQQLENDAAERAAEDRLNAGDS